MKAERIALMPYWPARMDEAMAANYLGVGLTSFRQRVAALTYPQPVQEGARKLWSRLQLDRFVAAQFGLPVDDQAGEGASRGAWDDL